MDISAVRSGLAAAAADAAGSTGLTCLSYVPDAIATPMLFPADIEQDFTGAMARGMDTLTVTVRVLVSRADDRAGQELLDSFLSGSGAASLKAAIEGTVGVPQTLDGACDDLMVLRA